MHDAAKRLGITFITETLVQNYPRPTAEEDNYDILEDSPSFDDTFVADLMKETDYERNLQKKAGWAK
jgi:hypothetical protein